MKIVQRKNGLIALMVVAICYPQFAYPTQDQARVRLSENSDWWSGLRSIDSDESIKAQEREVARSNFRIMGIELGEKAFVTATAKMGKTTIVERGDAALGREQLCFVSTTGTPKTFLIFEKGEVVYSFDLFSGGKAWKGQEQCAATTKVSPMTATGSGLRLGLTPKQVIAILGPPSVRRGNEFIYSLHVSKKYTEEDLKTVRKNLPNIGEEELRRNYEYYDWSAGFDCRFENSKLTYLGVSIAETNWSTRRVCECLEKAKSRFLASRTPLGMTISQGLLASIELVSGL